METNAVWLKLDEKNLVHDLQDARAQLSASGEVALDFAGVRRIDAATLKVMEELASAAKSKSAKVVLRAVDVSIYKVLKLAKLVSRFSFVS